MRPSTSTRDQRGSIVAMLLVAIVCTMLAFAFVGTMEFGLHDSRRAGSSANALQLADAGLNDAMKTIPHLSPGQSPYTSPLVDLGGSGSYQWTATLDPSGDVWHLDSTGTDLSHPQRRVHADAVAQSLFDNALFVRSSLQLPAGSAIDSFRDGSSAQSMCTRHGVLGTNDAADLAFTSNGGGVAQRNCTGSAYGISWPYPVDACVSYADANPVMPPTGQGACPPAPASFTETPSFTVPQIVGPGGSPVANPPTCDATHPIVTPATKQPFFWSSVTLRTGCTVDATNGPAIIYTTGKVDIGDVHGASGVVNPPPSAQSPQPANTSAFCPAGTITAGLNDANNNPSSYYCPGWSGNLRIYVLSNATGTNVILRNHVQFWGVIVDPPGTFAVDSNGKPHVEIWGAIIANSGAPSAQVALHYDDSLGGITTGQYGMRNWRECPLTGAC